MMRTTPTPTGPSERLQTVDVLRGCALLGILLINIRYMALPFGQWHDPGAHTESLGLANLGVWLLGQVFFEDKMMMLFTMLFGAGIVLMAERAEQSGRRAVWLHYQRIFWLAVIGHIHAYLIWFGDILTVYAFSGALVFPLRRLRPWLLVTLGVVLFFTSFGIRVVPALYRDQIYPAMTGEELPRPEPTEAQLARREKWETVAEGEARAHSGSYLDGVRWRAMINPLWHYSGYIRGEVWRGCGCMLIGLGLFRLGVFAGRAPPRAEMVLAVCGYAVGVPLVVVRVYAQLHGALGEDASLSPAVESLQPLFSEPSTVPRYLQHAISQIGVLCVVLGHVGTILLLCRVRWTGLARGLLAAVGRMALSNYLFDSLLAVLLFDVLGLWDTMTQSQLAMIVLAVWTLQLAASPMWLHHFRFGPAEWAWRSLTYRRFQPFRVATAASSAA
jgi:uncharacterized protein